MEFVPHVIDGQETELGELPASTTILVLEPPS